MPHYQTVLTNALSVLVPTRNGDLFSKCLISSYLGLNRLLLKKTNPKVIVTKSSDGNKKDENSGMSAKAFDSAVKP